MQDDDEDEEATQDDDEPMEVDGQHKTIPLDDTTPPVDYYKDFLSNETLNTVSKWIRKMEVKKEAFFAAAYGGNNYERDNVKKIIVKEFWKNGQLFPRGTDGEQHIYD